MYNIDCGSILDDQDADFYQLSTVVKNVRKYLNSFRTDQENIRVHSFEISQQLITPLQNLDDLLTILSKETGTTETQKTYLTTCERAVARFYCYIHYFIELHVDKCKVEPTVDESEQARRTAYDLYFNAMYELRNPYYILKGYSQFQIFESESKNWRDYISQIYSSPFVPENRDKVDKIGYWIEELGKFMDDLPRLRQEVKKENKT